MGQPFPGELLVEVSESKITELFNFFVCRGQCYDIFLAGVCVALSNLMVALFVFLRNCEFEI